MQPVTEASIQAAKDAQARERLLVYRQTGLRIQDDGRIVDTTKRDEKRPSL